MLKFILNFLSWFREFIGLVSVESEGIKFKDIGIKEFKENWI